MQQITNPINWPVLDMADEGTIDSQVAALRDRIRKDNCILPDSMCFIDDGVSGATLIRPKLERLRDCVAAGDIERLYVLSPDRQARKYAY